MAAGEVRPLPAPVTAVLVVRVTLHATLALGIRRSTGVPIAVGFADAVGLTWWEVCRVRRGPADCGGGAAVVGIRAGAGRPDAPDDEEHIASWEEQCGTGH